MSKNENVFNNADIDNCYMQALYGYYPRFEIVSFDQFKKDWCSAFNDWDGNNSDDVSDIKSIYNNISIPIRSTKYSAGYDFKSPINFMLNPGESIMIPTGIRSYMPSDMVLFIFPRSGLGTKYQFHPANLTCVIDSDYYNSDNEGHIHIRMVNNGDKPVAIEQGQAFTQGVFTKYYKVLGDSASGIRNGGMGSTDNPTTDNQTGDNSTAYDAFNDTLKKFSVYKELDYKYNNFTEPLY